MIQQRGNWARGLWACAACLFWIAPVATAQADDPLFGDPEDARGLLAWEAVAYPHRATDDSQALGWMAYVYLKALAFDRSEVLVERLLGQDPSNPDARRYWIEVAAYRGANPGRVAQQARDWLGTHELLPESHRSSVRMTLAALEREQVRRAAVAGARKRAVLAPFLGLLAVAGVALWATRFRAR